MTTVFVERDAGKIVGIFTAAQPGSAEEELDDNNAEVIAFRRPPAAPLTMRQFRLGLLAAGLLTTVEAAIEGLGPAARIEFEYASSVLRDNILVTSLAASLGLSDEQVDTLWSSALSL